MQLVHVIWRHGRICWSFMNAQIWELLQSILSKWSSPEFLAVKTSPQLAMTLSQLQIQINMNIRWSCIGLILKQYPPSVLRPAWLSVLNLVLSAMTDLSLHAIEKWPEWSTSISLLPSNFSYHLSVLVDNSISYLRCVIVCVMTSVQPTHRLPDESRGAAVLASVWSTMIIGIIVVSLRFYVRWRKSAHGWDDYTIYSALVTISSFSSYRTVMTRFLGRLHIWYSSEH